MQRRFVALERTYRHVNDRNPGDLTTTVDLSLRRDVYERLEIHATLQHESPSTLVERAIDEYSDLVERCDLEERELVRRLTSSPE